ncbi:MAG: D-aminoacylase [Alphaproteobacteria bacterium]|nr:D-aminoacylase [Alphaproteobacteria bacterium]
MRCFLLLLIFISSSLHANDKWDLLIRNGLVIDGTGAAGQRLVIGIEGDRIVYVGPDREGFDAKDVIDAEGLVVTPGFIDPHTHAWDERGAQGGILLESYLTQGITTVFSGNDGKGPSDVGAALGELAQRGLGANMALFVGHGTVRRQVLGMDAREPTPQELAEMKKLVITSMKAGALGVSSGLFYAPGSFAKTEEVVELARVAAGFGGVYETHIRDESNYSIGLQAAIEEAIEVGRIAGVPVHIAHIKALGVDVWGQSNEVIARIDAARAEGIRVTADQYPWRASGTRISNALVPRWAMAGGRIQMLARLKAPESKGRIHEQMWENLRRRGGAEAILLTGGKFEWRGQTLAHFAEVRGESAIAAADYILHEGDAGIASFNMHEDDIQAFMAQPWVMTSSDGGAGHPRKYASFPNKFRRYVDELSLLPLEDFVHKSTLLTARTFGLVNRGVISEGAFADVLLFDPQVFGPIATYAQPAKPSVGVQYLLVNGKLAIRQGQLTGHLAGNSLARQH